MYVYLASENCTSAYRINIGKVSIELLPSGYQIPRQLNIASGNSSCCHVDISSALPAGIVVFCLLRRAAGRSMAPAEPCSGRPSMCGLQVVTTANRVSIDADRGADGDRNGIWRPMLRLQRRGKKKEAKMDQARNTMARPPLASTHPGPCFPVQPKL